jgi:hypothetical protein
MHLNDVLEWAYRELAVGRVRQLPAFSLGYVLFSFLTLHIA